MKTSQLIVPLLGLAFAAAPAVAQQVGTATAVNPLSESTPPGGSTAPLVVGAHIVHKERIHTSPAGTMQLLFTDKSSMSIAPNTDIVIDEYVYNPGAKDGQMLVSLTKGALRFVGGQLSHQGEATITTSAANIGIRGGTVTVIQGQNGTTVINHFGITTITNNTGTFTLSRSDFGALIQSLTSVIQDLGRIPPGDVAFYQAHTTSLPGQNGGVIGFNGTNIGHCGFGALQGTNCPQTPWSPTTGGEYSATQLLGNATNFGTNQINPPPPPPPPRGPPCGNRC